MSIAPDVVQHLHGSSERPFCVDDPFGLALGVISEARAFALDHAAIDHPNHASGWVRSLLNDRPSDFLAPHKGQMDDTLLTLIK